MNYGIGITFSFGIGTFVAFIPQGLPVTVTLLLTIAAKRLSKKQVLVKDLNAVETLGSITVLATDKTGTLTQNKMSVVCLWMNNLVYGGNLDKLDPSKLLSPGTPNASDLLNVCGLCSKYWQLHCWVILISRSKFDPSESSLPAKERRIFGDATEIGLLKFALNYYDIPEAMNKFPKAFEIPFNSTNKWHLTILKMPHESGPYTLMIKGAPERVKKMCKFIRINDEDVPWTEEHDKLFEGAYEFFASRGRRVLAFAHKKLSADLHPEGFEFLKDPFNFKNDDFVFLGLIGLMDPPKHGVRKAVAACRTAGIQVIMITGDHPLTAEAIARNVGLIQGKTAHDVAKMQNKPLELVGEDEYDAVVVHGDEIDELATEDWDKILSKLEIVFARTSPKHKLEIVTRLQSKGHIVGVQIRISLIFIML
jgi:sodium/potassium-transporting ATPase subunit alpha